MKSADQRAMRTAQMLHSLPNKPGHPTGDAALELTQDQALRLSSRIRRGVARGTGWQARTRTFGGPQSGYAPTGNEGRRKNPHRTRGAGPKRGRRGGAAGVKKGG